MMIAREAAELFTIFYLPTQRGHIIVSAITNARILITLTNTQKGKDVFYEKKNKQRNKQVAIVINK